MERRERIVAVLLGLAGVMVAAGTALLEPAAGLIVAGLALAAWTVVTLTE